MLNTDTSVQSPPPDGGRALSFLVWADDAVRHCRKDAARSVFVGQPAGGDKDCSVILCLAGSLISAGLKGVIVEMIRSRMVDAIVSTGANIVDQDFFEALGYRRERFPAELTADLVYALGREIQPEKKRNEFQIEMVRLIRDKGYAG